jgi:hypothetical protein
MKYIKNFESIRDEYPGMFSPRNPEEEPQSVPGFEDGTIDPDDNETYDGLEDLFGEISDAESYKIFIKTTKERNFEENETEIKINLNRLGQDYCMSIYNPDKHFSKFLNDELRGKYISKGLINIMENIPDLDFTPIEGIIEDVKVHINGGDCSSYTNLKLKGIKFDRDHTICQNIIIIDKLKSSANKYNL